MLTRRELLKFLGMIPLILGLRLPMAEDGPIEEDYIEEVVGADTLDSYTRDYLINSYAKPGADNSGLWWGYGTDGKLWVSHDFGNTWQEDEILCPDFTSFDADGFTINWGSMNHADT